MPMFGLCAQFGLTSQQRCSKTSGNQKVIYEKYQAYEMTSALRTTKQTVTIQLGKEITEEIRQTPACLQAAQR